MFMKVNVFITVDAEHSIGGAFSDQTLSPVGNDRRIFGKIGNKEYGIPLIIEIARRYDLPLTFFVEVFSKSYFGEDETKKVCDYILDKGYEIQLHLHPLFLNFGRPNPKELFYEATINSYNEDTQAEMIEAGKDILIRYGVKEPIAFRAGGFAANIDTLKALRRNGFLIDSSLNRRYLGAPCMLNALDINDICEVDGVWELPITNFLEFSWLAGGRPKPLDINGVSFQEIKSVLEKASENGPGNVTILMHSFSFIQNSDVQYQKMRTRWRVIQRFEKLCKFLANNQNTYIVRTVGTLSQNNLVIMNRKSNHVLPRVSTLPSMVRLVEQTIERLGLRR